MHYGVRFVVTLLVAISVFASRKDLPRKILVFVTGCLRPSYSDKNKLKVNSRQNFPHCISMDPLVTLRKLQISISTDRFGGDMSVARTCAHKRTVSMQLRALT